MTNEEKITFINYRPERANELLKAAQLMLDNKLYIPAMNRIYYAMFYSVQALLIEKEKSFSKHGQVKGFFNKNFIKPGLLAKEFGSVYNKTFEYRQKFDYVDLQVPSHELVVDYISKAKNFVEEITLYLKNKLNESN